MPLLDVADLHVHFLLGRERARAVDGVSFSVAAGRKFGLVGESGCGKSVSARAVLGLLPRKDVFVSGRADFDAAGDLLSLPDEAMRKVRGAAVAAVFQDPMTYLNPVFTVGEQIAEGLRLHKGMNKAQALDAAAELLARVRIRNPRACLRAYPFQLSGGMRQRALIAMALACGPRLLIADEPTTALDVTVQARVLAVLRELADESGMALWLITHDMGVVAETCDSVAVMYAGRIAECGSAAEVLKAPAHPYTKGLLEAVRSLDAGRVRSSIPGQIHPPTQHPPGCRFHPRCRSAFDKCRTADPPEFPLSPTHAAACWLMTAQSKLGAASSAPTKNRK